MNEFQNNSENKEKKMDYDSLNDAYLKLEDKYLKLREQYEEQNRELQFVRNQFNEISNAFFWKISKPIRSIITPVKLALKTFGADKRRKGKKAAPAGDTLLRLFEKKHIVILTTVHTLYVAKLIGDALKKIDIESKTLTEEPEIYEDFLYIVVCPQMFKRMPDFYIAFQMEQTISTRWFDQNYLDKLENAYAVFDYSISNIDSFKKHSLFCNRLCYLPIDLHPSIINTTESYDYDVLFYGDTECPRRREFLQQIQKRFKIKILYNVFGIELENEIKKAKIVVNIHYYENSLLETTRLYEVLSLGRSVIVSERSSDSVEEKKLDGIVDFVDTWDIESLIEQIDYWLSHENERKEFVNRNNNILSSRSNSFYSYFYRFLFSNNLIGFDLFRELAGDYFTLNSNRICLSLPEYDSAQQ